MWAKQVLEAGDKTAYCADSLVYHSQSYGPWDNGRHFDHAWVLLLLSREGQATIEVRCGSYKLCTGFPPANRPEPSW